MFKKTGHSEDLHLGTSLGWMGIHPGDTRDSEGSPYACMRLARHYRDSNCGVGRERFLPLRIDHLRYKHTRERKPGQCDLHGEDVALILGRPLVLEI